MLRRLGAGLPPHRGEAGLQSDYARLMSAATIRTGLGAVVGLQERSDEAWLGAAQPPPRPGEEIVIGWRR